MDISIIRQREALDALRNEWDALLADSAVDTLFLTWEWVTAWLDSVPNKANIELYVIVIRDEQQKLIGIAPCYRLNYKLFKLIPVKVLRVLGDENTGGEYPGFITHTEQQQTILGKLFEFLQTHQSDWDLLWLTRMSGWDGQNEAMREVINQFDYACVTRPRSFSHFMLPTGWDEFEKSLSSNRRQQFRRQAKKIHARGDIEITRCQSKDELPEYLEALFRLHAARRALLGDAGTFNRKPQQLAFYRLFTELALANNWLWFYALREQGEIKAIQIGYVRNKVFYQLQEGFEPDYPPGAGNVLRQAVVQDCIEQGIREYDFLGEHTEHKRRWTAAERTGQDMLIGSRGFIARLILAKPFWPTGRFLRPIN